MPASQIFTIDPAFAGQRLDMALAGILPELGKRGAKRLINLGSVALNGKMASPSIRVRAGDIVALWEAARGVEIAAKLLKASDPFLFIFKPARAHCAQIGGGEGQSLEHILPRLLTENGIAEQAGLLQRLDYGTSGIVLAATNVCGKMEFLRAQEEGSCQKLYLALLAGILPGQITVANKVDVNKRKKSKVLEKEDQPLRHTVFTPIHIWSESDELLEQWPRMRECRPIMNNSKKGFTLAGCAIKKGARHQIRAHAAHIGFPLIGDGLYNEDALENDVFFLHQARLSFCAHDCLCLPEWLPDVAESETMGWLETRRD